MFTPSSTISTTYLTTQSLSATRYVKVSRKLINLPRHGTYGRLEEDKRVCLKTSSICHPSRSWHQHLFEILAKTAEKRDVIDVVRLFLQCATHVGCLLSSLWPLPWPSPPYKPNAHLISALSQPQCPPHLLIPHYPIHPKYHNSKLRVNWTSIRKAL